MVTNYGGCLPAQSARCVRTCGSHSIFGGYLTVDSGRLLWGLIERISLIRLPLRQSPFRRIGGTRNESLVFALRNAKRCCPNLCCWALSTRSDAPRSRRRNLAGGKPKAPPPEIVVFSNRALKGRRRLQRRTPPATTPGWDQLKRYSRWRRLRLGTC